MYVFSFVCNVSLSQSGLHVPLIRVNWSLQFTITESGGIVIDELSNKGITSKNKGTSK